MEAYIIATGTVLAGLFTGILTWWSSRSKKRIASLERRYLEALLEVKAFIALERLYSMKMAKEQGILRTTIKDRMRKELKKKSDGPGRFSRPSNILSEIKRITGVRSVITNRLTEAERAYL